MLSRIPDVIRSRAFDVTLLQRELLSTIETLERFTGRPRILDVDDALWVLPRGRFAGAIAARCDRVVAGNAFLAEYFSQYCRSVVIVPTAVDTARFVPVFRPDDADRVVIGWSGGRAGLVALESIAPALTRLVTLRPQVVIRVLCDARPALIGVPPSQVQHVPWSAAVEAETIASFDIGVMPLEDGVWERGKCSYKMLLYMACGVPAVVSPVGMNAEVLALGSVGRGATDPGSWLEHLLDFVDSPEKRKATGTRARQVIEQNFSLGAIVPRLAAALRGDSWAA